MALSGMQSRSSPAADTCGHVPSTGHATQHLHEPSRAGATARAAYLHRISPGAGPPQRLNSSHRCNCSQLRASGLAGAAGLEVCCTANPHLAEGLRHLLAFSCSSHPYMVTAALVKLMSVYSAIILDVREIDLAAVMSTPLPASCLRFGS